MAEPEASDAASVAPPAPREAPPRRQASAGRLKFIDASRGFFVMWMTLGEYSNEDCGSSPACKYFFDHMPRTATSATAYDLVMVGFLMFIGFLFTRSFTRRAQRDGTWSAVLHAVLRNAALLVTGLVLLRIDDLKPLLWSFDSDTLSIPWDVLPSLGLAGLIAIIPMVALLKFPWRRLIAGSAFILVYQLLLVIPQTGWREFAHKSVHGGVLATVFVFSGIIVIASALGDLLLPERERHAGATPQETEGLVSRDQTAASEEGGWLQELGSKPPECRLLLIGAALAVAAVLLAQIPELYASKREATLSWAVLALGLSCLVSGVFWILESAYGISAPLLVWWGCNPFFIYILGNGVTSVLEAIAVACGVELHAGAAFVLMLVGTGICTVAVYALRSHTIDTLHICVAICVCALPSFVLTYTHYEWLEQREMLRRTVFFDLPKLLGLAVAVIYTFHGQRLVARAGEALASLMRTCRSEQTAQIVV